MSTKLTELFENNLKWSKKMTKEDPEYFERLSHQQAPKYLWIGCSDSRVPANQITGMQPGEVFVHRNVAQLVIHTDLNCLSVIQYAVEVLKVDHIIVCGHYNCGGVRAVVEERRLGLIDNWLRHLADVKERFAHKMAALPDIESRVHELCELNVKEQVLHVCETTIIQKAWTRGHELSVHGWVYSLEDGLLRDVLETPILSMKEYRALQKKQNP